MSLQQHVMSSHPKRRFIARAVDSLLSSEGQKRFKISWEGERVPEQRNAYLKHVKNVVSKNKERAHALKELLGELKVAFNEQKDQSFWEILASQLERYVVGG